MFNFIKDLLQSIFKIFFTKRKNIIFTILLLKKENEIYKEFLETRINSA